MKNNKISINQVTTGQMLGLMLLAYIFSFVLRLIWVYQFQDNPNFIWNNELMINTHDGYFFASGAQKELFGLHMDNPRVFGMWDHGVIFFTTLFAKITPFSLDTIILYMPAIISSLVVIPMILIARLYNQTLWGFFAALLGSITWSYYNRTMTGYYDTDMFSAMAPMIILFFLLKNTKDLKLSSALYAGIAIIIYPFLYDQGQAIVYAIGITYGIYMLWFHEKENISYQALILIFVALMPLPFGIEQPFDYLLHLIILVGVYLFLKKDTLEKKHLQIVLGMVFFLFMLLGNVYGLILGKIISYTVKGTEEGTLHFYAVNQTVREAGRIPFETFANRTSGSVVGVIIALIGYVVLVFRRPAFILALPLIGIGIFSLWGGLRFTVYAVPIAGMSAVYLFWVIAEKFIKQKVAQYLFIVVATGLMIYPNITHIIGYKVPTVLNKAEVQDLVKLDKIADDKDYTLTWWDYGYPIWFYSGTNTLIDGGKHNYDNFIISTIMQTDSPQLAANLSRLAVETYVDSNYSVVANTIFKNGKKDQVDPNLFLSQLQDESFRLPAKTRDIFLYLPYHMFRIFPVVTVFGNLDLNTGKELRQIIFHPTTLASNNNGVFTFANGIVFDTKKGKVRIGRAEKDVKSFIITQNRKDGNIALQKRSYHINGEIVIVFMKSYSKFMVMDAKTFQSMYVQMFMLGRYDKNLFELVLASPYSRIYKIKR